MIQDQELLICLDCKSHWVGKPSSCKCGCKTFADANEDNRIYARNATLFSEYDIVFKFLNDDIDSIDKFVNVNNESIHITSDMVGYETQLILTRLGSENGSIMNRLGTSKLIKLKKIKDYSQEKNYFYTR